MTAQSIENTDNNNNSDNYIINRKKTNNNNNKTQKRMPSTFGDIDHSKVQNVLNSIYKNLGDDSDNNLGDYKPRSISAPVNTPYAPINPLAPPASMRQKQEKEQEKQKDSGQGNKEGMSNYDYNSEDVDNYSNKFVPQPVQNDTMDLQDLQDVYMNNEQVKRYFKNLVPNFQSSDSNPNQTGIQSSGGNTGLNAGANTGANTNPRQSLNHNSNMSDTNQLLVDKLNYMINLLEEQQDERTNNVTEEVILYSFLGVFIIFVVDGFARVTRYTR